MKKLFLCTLSCKPMWKSKCRKRHFHVKSSAHLIIHEPFMLQKFLENLFVKVDL